MGCNMWFYPAGRWVLWKSTMEFTGGGFSSALADETERYSAQTAAERSVLSLHFNASTHLPIARIITEIIIYLKELYDLIRSLFLRLTGAVRPHRNSGASPNVSHLSKYLKSDDQIRLALHGKQHNYIPPKMLLSLIKIKCCDVIYKDGLSN